MTEEKTLREKMTPAERDYVRSAILEVLEKETEKLHLFGSANRAGLVVENAINSLSYDKEKFEIKVDVRRVDRDNKVWFHISSGPYDCVERVIYSRGLTFESDKLY